jgi:hypothetical protein
MSGPGAARRWGGHEKEKAMKQLLIAPLLAATLVLSGAGPAAADRAFEESLVETFVDIDPCTGLEHEVTIDVTFHVHIHDDNTVARGVHSLSTTLGYTGRGTSSYVWNGNVEMFRVTDLLTNDSGDRISARVVFLADLRSETVWIDKFELTCLGSRTKQKQEE